MDPATLGMMALGSLMGGGGGGTSVSQSLENNFNSNINTIIQGAGASPTTGAVSQPQTGTATADATGNTPQSSGTGLLDSLGLGGSSTVPTTPATTGNVSTAVGMSSEWIYWGGAAIAVAGGAFLMFGKKRRR